MARQVRIVLNAGLLLISFALFFFMGCGGNTNTTTDAGESISSVDSGESTTSPDVTGPEQSVVENGPEVTPETTVEKGPEVDPTDCTLTINKGCTPGNSCNFNSKKCVCAPAACQRESDSGCHPQKNRCEKHCTDDNECQAGEKCLTSGGEKFCLDPSQLQHECDSDTDCTDSAKPVCDTSQTPRVCIPKPGCKSNTDCTTAPKLACDTLTGACVECIEDKDCKTGEVCDSTTKACKQGPQTTACVDSKTCYNAVPRSYCPTNKANGCQAAVDCSTATLAPTGDNTAWSSDATAPVLWGASATAFADHKNCWSWADANGASVGSDFTQAKKCTSDSDCKTPSTCRTLGTSQGCGVGDTDGAMKLTFSFYAPNGIKDDRKAAWLHPPGTQGRALTTPLTVTTGDTTNKTWGTAEFTFCEKGATGKTFSFFVFDSQDNPSNRTCYTP